MGNRRKELRKQKRKEKKNPISTSCDNTTPATSAVSRTLVLADLIEQENNTNHDFDADSDARVYDGQQEMSFDPGSVDESPTDEDL